ncbi:MAG TPA: NGG1p interacting factor NIF3 [bacterium]|nr:NGG1p interacting factor NIF3 [bacterium]
MKLSDIYKAAVEAGIRRDPRGEKEVRAALAREKKRYSAMSEKEKKFYDSEKLSNPYADSRIIYDNGADIKSVLVGIDIDTSEILLAEKLGEKGKKIDGIIAHHPSGRAFARFYDVMDMQADIFSLYGVTISAGQDLTEKRMKEVGEKIMAANHYRAYDAARLLDIPFMNMHTISDNAVATYLQSRFDGEKPETVSDIMDMLYQEDEYRISAERGIPPVVLTGAKERKVKKVFVDMTGGTEGSKEIYARLSAAGIDTLVGMHFSDDHKKAIQAAGMNAVIAGHISSDSLGINLILDDIEKSEGQLKIYETSGFTRVKRGACESNNRRGLVPGKKRGNRGRSRR